MHSDITTHKSWMEENSISDKKKSTNEKISIKWTNRTDHLVSVFQECRDSEQFADVTLIANGQRYRAHKIVLSSCSPFFEDLLKESNCDHPVIIIDSVSDKELKCILDYTYLGQVSIAYEQIETFIDIGKMLQIKGLCEKVTEAYEAKKRQHPECEFKKPNKKSKLISHCKENNPSQDHTSQEYKNKLNSAIKAVITQKMTFSSASKEFGVAKMTLYDNVLGKTNRRRILEQIELQENEFNAICLFCSELGCTQNIRTRKSIREIVSYMVELKRLKDPAFSVSELIGFKWWWAFSKKYNIVSLYKPPGT